MRKILLIDDDKLFLRMSEMMLSDEFNIITASSVQDAKIILDTQEVDVAVVDLHFEGHVLDGTDMLNYLQKEHATTPFIVMSGDENTSRVVDAMKRPLVDFVVKNGDHDVRLRSAIRKAIILTQDEGERNRANFSTKSPKVKNMIKDLGKVLDTSQEKSILVLGESGSGKEYVAKYISEYLDKKIVSINMANINKSMAESILFGHKRGAFTGACSDQLGVIEKAHGGILFLDEIGECSLEVQAKLLRAIQSREITPLGSTKSKKIDTLIVAATHQNLNEMVEAGSFRLDLLQRLSTFQFQVPALRDRKIDIEYYAQIFLSEFSNSEAFPILPCAMDILNNHDWNGNIRELKNFIQRAVVYSPNKSLDKNTALKSLGLDRVPVSFNHKAYNIPKRLKTDNKREVILGVLESVSGNRTEAARVLEVNPSTLYRWIKKYNLTDIATPVTWGRPTVI